MNKTEPPRLFCDVMLGTLARRLRLLGIDVRYERGLKSLDAYRQARADRRIFLTRYYRMKNLPDVLLLESENVDRQVEQVCQALNIQTEEKKDETGVLTRCSVCNEVLKKISREQARPAVPFYIYQIHNEFRRCPRCQRVYWPGSHIQKMRLKGGR
ncbi:MAG: Mut7-C RNAse domain-containing protein [candidate division WOR-3 bacterium]